MVPSARHWLVEACIRCNVAMKNVLTFDAVADGDSMALLIVPSLVGRLSFGEELPGVAAGDFVCLKKTPCTLNASVQTCQPFSSKRMMPKHRE